MRDGRMLGAVVALFVAVNATDLNAQAQVRLENGVRGTYSELHEGLRLGAASGDSVAAVLNESNTLTLWKRVRAVLADKAPWNDAVLVLTRIAQLPASSVADSATALVTQIEAGTLKVPPARDARDLLESLRTVELSARRAKLGDASLRDELLAKVTARRYGLADAYTLGTLGAGTADSVTARFLAAATEEDKVRYLTLLSFSTDSSLVPLLGRIFAAPDSFALQPRFGSRASDGLIWIGTRQAYKTLATARATARGRGIYDDPMLARGGYDFLANDSSAVISRTGRWIDEWLERLK